MTKTTWADSLVNDLCVTTTEITATAKYCKDALRHEAPVERGEVKGSAQSGAGKGRRNPDTGGTGQQRQTVSVRKARREGIGPQERVVRSHQMENRLQPDCCGRTRDCTPGSRDGDDFSPPEGGSTRRHEQACRTHARLQGKSWPPCVSIGQKAVNEGIAPNPPTPLLTRVGGRAGSSLVSLCADPSETTQWKRPRVDSVDGSIVRE